jgi:hypothetical protein
MNLRRLVTAIVVLGVLAGAAHAARAPSPTEKRELTQVVLGYFDGLYSTWDTKASGPKPRISVKTIRVAPVVSGAYGQFAIIYTRAVNADAPDVLLGRRGGLWRVITYGTSEVGCHENLGLHRSRVLAALEITCM